MSKSYLETIVNRDTTPKKFSCIESIECAECKANYCPACHKECPVCKSKLVFKFWKDDTPGLQEVCLACNHAPGKCGIKGKPFSKHPDYDEEKHSDKYKSLIYTCRGFTLRSTFKKYLQVPL